MKFRNILKGENVREFSKEITDDKKIKEYETLLEEGKDLPEGVTYTTKTNEEYPEDGSEIRTYTEYTFYEIMAEEEIEDAIKIKNSNSLADMAKSLRFFKVLTIVSLIISLILVIIGLFVSLF